MNRSISRLLALCAVAPLALGALAVDAPAQEAAKPRVLVLTFDKGDDTPRDMIQGIAEETLVDLGFPLVDSGQLSARYQLADLEKFIILTPERTRLAELKTRFGAEVILVVQYTRTFRYEKEFMGTKQRYYVTSIRVKAIQPDTAAVIHSSGDRTSITARLNEMEELTQTHVRKAGEKLLANWSEAAEGVPQALQILAKGFDHDNLSRLEASLKTVPGILAVDRRDFGGPAVGEGNALLEVQSDASADDISRFLGTLQNPAVEVIGSTPSRIEIKLAKKLEVGFVTPTEGQMIRGTSVVAMVRTSASVTQVTIGGVSATRVEGGWSATVPVRSGRQTIEAGASDDLGRQAVARVTVQADGAPPTVSILSPRGGIASTKQVVVQVRAADDGGAVSVTINGAPAQQQGDLFVATVALQPGANTITAVATDAVGLSAQDRVTLTLDATPPTVTIVDPTDGELRNKRSVVVLVRAADNAGRVTVTLNGKPMATVDGGFRTEIGLDEGLNRLTAVATDQAGLTASDSVEVTVDSTPPRLNGTVIAVIEGQVELGSRVTTEDGQEVPLDEEGRFRITVQAPVGGTVTIIATDAAGNRTEQVYRIGGATEER